MNKGSITGVCSMCGKALTLANPCAGGIKLTLGKTVMVGAKRGRFMSVQLLENNRCILEVFVEGNRVSNWFRPEYVTDLPQEAAADE